MSINLQVPFLQIGPPMVLVVVAIMIFSILIYTVLSWKIYRNNKNKIEPVHVFQLNYLIGVTAPEYFLLSLRISIVTRNFVVIISLGFFAFPIVALI